MSKQRLLSPFFIFLALACTNPLAPSSSVDSSYLPGLSSSTTNPITLRSGLIAYWNLDSNANDISGNGNNLSINNGATVYGSGILNNGVSISDSTGYSLTAPTFSQFNLTQDFSVSLWFKATQHFYDGQCLVCTWNNFSLWYRPPPSYHSSVYFYIQTTSSGEFIKNPDNAIVQNTWNHIVATKSGSNYVIYLNGAVSASGTLVGTPIAETTPHLNFDIGNSSHVGYPLNGTIDEIGVWNRALTATEAAKLYNNGSAWAFSLF